MTDCKLSFSAVSIAIMCIGRTRSSNNRSLWEADIILAASEGSIQLDKLDLFVRVDVLQKIILKYIYIYINISAVHSNTGE